MNDVVDYIRANRTRYTREAVSHQLLAAGHSREVIAAAWEVADRDSPPASAGSAAGFIKGYSVLVFLLGATTPVAGVVGALGMVQFLTPPEAVAAVAGAVLGVAIYVGLGLLALRFIFRRADERRPGPGWGLAAGCLVPVLMFGICTAAALPTVWF
jgi:hypothetical protein